MKIVGKVLWWDQKDQNSVIRDLSGREIYFDISVTDRRLGAKLKSGISVSFEINTKIKNCLAALSVKPANAREQSKIKKQFAGRRQPSLFA